MRRLLTCLLWCTACGGGVVDIEADDVPAEMTGADAGPLDAGRAEAGADAGARDAGEPDAGSDDAGALDLVTVDAGGVDAGGFDAGPADAGVDGGPVDAGPMRFDAGSLDAGPPRRRVLVCLTGAIDHGSASNAEFASLCDGLRDAGLVGDCASTGCNSTFGTFPLTVANAPLNAAFDAMDRNRDNRVDARDGLIDLTVLGFSWGGVNAGWLSQRLSSDSRVTASVVHHRLIILDAFQAGVSNPMRVVAAPNVDEAWSFRRSLVPSNDCSSGAPLGPYRGVRLACGPGRACRDFDFSLAPTRLFNGVPGSFVGHCEVPRAAAPYVVELVRTGRITSSLPPDVPVMP